jgi:site-specific recombinase XerC
MNQLVPVSSAMLPALVAAAGERAGMRFLEFFAANIRNPHTRRAYARAADEFLAWCASAGVPSIGAVQPVHVATWIEAGTRELAAPSVKQRLAAIRHLFDWLVTGQVVLSSTARSACAIGPKAETNASNSTSEAFPRLIGSSPRPNLSVMLSAIRAISV